MNKDTKAAVAAVSNMIDFNALCAAECANHGLDTPLIARHGLDGLRAEFLAADTAIVDSEIRAQKQALDRARKSAEYVAGKKRAAGITITMIEHREIAPAIVRAFRV